MAEVVILPVVRIERAPGEDALWAEDAAVLLGPPAPVTDINAFRYARERAAVERRERTTLLPCDCGDA